jgi:hypothetical protein
LDWRDILVLSRVGACSAGLVAASWPKLHRSSLPVSGIETGIFLLHLLTAETGTLLLSTAVQHFAPLLEGGSAETRISIRLPQMRRQRQPRLPTWQDVSSFDEPE